MAAFIAAMISAQSQAAPKSHPEIGIKAGRMIILRAIAADHIPGAAIAIRRNSKLVWSEAFGFANLELGVKASRSTRFRLASVSKPITAALAVKLERDGLVALNEPICHYANDLPSQHCSTTLDQLLSHRGGIRHYQDKDYDLAAVGGRPDTRIYPDARSKLAVFIDDPLVASPGTTTQYSTFGYVLAGYVLERATHLNFATLMDREIGKPLGLRSLSTDDIFAVRLLRASGYDPISDYLELDPALKGEVVRTDAFNSMFRIPAGGLIATAEDVSAFGASALASPSQYGWEIVRRKPGKEIRFATGSQQGSRSILYLDASKGLSIAILTNLGDRPKDIRGLAESIASHF